VANRSTMKAARVGLVDQEHTCGAISWGSPWLHQFEPAARGQRILFCYWASSQADCLSFQNDSKVAFLESVIDSNDNCTVSDL
jgi:hypothetical protein